MSVAPAAYKPAAQSVEDASSRVRATAPTWEGFRSAKIISEAEFNLIRQYDKQEPFVQSGLLERDGDRYGFLFLTLLTKIKTEDNVQYMLTLIDDVLLDHPERVKIFSNTATVDEALPYGPLLKCLEKDNVYITHKASGIITALLCAGCKMKPADFDWFLGWLGQRLRSTSEEHMQAAIGALQNLLVVDEYRVKFFETPDGVSCLVEILKNRQPNFQVQYQIIFSLWLLSFNKTAARALNKWKIISLLTDIIRSSLKEKVIRIALATLRNLLEKAPEVNLGPLMDVKFLNLCQVLAGRKWTDEDIVADLEVLTTELQKNAHELTSFEEYAAELRSGKLEWTPMHRSETFWKQNAQRLNEQNYELLRILARLLSTSTDPTILAIAAHDVGEYVTAHPRGKRFIQELGAKQRIMELMGNENPTVRYEALLSTQKFMVNNWEYLSKTSAVAPPAGQAEKLAA